MGKPLDKRTPGVTIRIRDRGGGISPANYAKLWDYGFTTFNEDEINDKVSGGAGNGGAGLDVISGAGGGGSSLAGLWFASWACVCGILWRWHRSPKPLGLGYGCVSQLKGSGAHAMRYLRTARQPFRL